VRMLGMECLGSSNEPVAEAVYLCVYWGQGEGSLEKDDTNAKFFKFRRPSGENGRAGQDGEVVIFRAKGFSETKPITALATEVSLIAEGVWAVRAN